MSKRVKQNHVVLHRASRANRLRRGQGPFNLLAELLESGRLALPETTDKPLRPPTRLADELSDDEAFKREMSSVRALGWSDTPLELPRPVEISRQATNECEALAQLQEFVDGKGEFDAFAAGLGMEGAASRRARGLLRRLKGGHFSVQAQLDLHGSTAEEARPVLEGFLRRSRQRGFCCVRVIHGRGRHSAEEPAVLKRSLRRWLSSRRLSTSVVAFASAKWRDGGAGAVYVLLYQ